MNGWQFSCSTPAAPARVWSALTEPDQTRTYLYGLAAHSSWQPNAPIEFRHDAVVLHGHVMHVDPPCRLSYCLAAGPDDPVIYVTWQIRTCPAGSTIRLLVDDPDPSGADTEEAAEDAWLPVLAALQSLLSH